MQEVIQVHQNLQEARSEDGGQGRRGGPGAAPHQGKRDGGQNKGKNEAGEVRFETSPADAAAVDRCLIHFTQLPSGRRY